MQAIIRLPNRPMYVQTWIIIRLTNESTFSLYNLILHLVKINIYCHVYGGSAWFVRRVLDWMFGFIDTLFTQLGTTGNYSATADLHTLQFTVTYALGFSVFTSHILATHLSESHCNFKKHMKFSCQSLIPVSPSSLKHLRLPSPEIDPFLHNHLPKWSLLQLNALNF
jgi:hypothetical protein